MKKPKSKSKPAGKTPAVVKQPEPPVTGGASDGFVTVPRTTTHQIESYLREHYAFRFNVVTGRLEYKLKQGEEYELLKDRVVNSMLLELKKKGVECYITDLRGILNSDYTPEYNPFLEYFLQSLPKYDGVTDHIAALAATVRTTDDELWQKCFKKWIVAVVGCAIDDAVVNHCLIVFSGKQGTGKTSWMLRLVPDELKNYCYNGNVNPNNKDTLVHLSECLLINLDELENLNKTEIGSLKELITKSKIRLRKAYGYHPENLVRRASFLGSVNTRDFLNDITGNRRFLCFDALHIDYEHKINMSDVYAQALHLFNSGYKFWFDLAEIRQINENNEQYRALTLEEELLCTWYTPVPEADAKLFLTTTELAMALSAKAKLSVSNPALKRLGSALRKHNFVRLKRGKRYVFALQEKDTEIVDYQSRYKMDDDKKVG